MSVSVKRTHCPPPVDIAYGNWVIIGEFPNYPIYTRIRYECSAGYAPQKPVFITCLKNGFWSDNPPKCGKLLFKQVLVSLLSLSGLPLVREKPGNFKVREKSGNFRIC